MGNAIIALGGNVGDVRATFRKAIADICGMAQAALLARSSDYATPPWGNEQQARFINACIAIETSLDPHALLSPRQKIERKFDRAFVLVALVEIAPDRVIAGRSFKAALEGLSTEGIERLPDTGD